MFETLQIRNFRGIQSLNVDGFRTINLVTGKNGAGKTTLLEALFLNMGANNAALAKKISEFRGDFEETPYNYRFFLGLFRDLNTELKPEILATTRDGKTRTGNRRHLTIIPKMAGTDGTAPTSDASTGAERTVEGAQFKFRGPAGEVEGLMTWHSLPGVTLPSGQEASGFGLRFSGEFSSDLINGHFNSPYTRDNWRQTHSQLTDLVKSRRVQDVVHGLNYVAPGLRDLLPLSEGDVPVVYADIGGDALIPAPLLGAGFVYSLRILVLVEHFKNGVVLIEEIENGLHFSATKGMIGRIFEACAKNNIQFFITTHSDEVIKGFADVSTEIGFSDLALFKLGKRGDDTFCTRFDWHDIVDAIGISAEVR